MLAADWPSRGSSQPSHARLPAGWAVHEQASRSRLSESAKLGQGARRAPFELGLGDGIGGFAQHWQAPPRQEPLPMAGSLRLWQEPLPMAALGEVQGIEVAS